MHRGSELPKTPWLCGQRVDNAWSHGPVKRNKAQSMKKNYYLRGVQFLRFLRETGMRSGLKLVRRKIKEALGLPEGGSPGKGHGPIRCETFNSRRFIHTAPIAVHPVPKPDAPRVTLITDSVGAGSLFGGVGTALLLGILMANRINGTLRILTRTEWPDGNQVGSVLSAYGISPDREVQLAFSPLTSNESAKRSQSIDVHEGELFLTTSWWSTAAALASLPPASVFYLLQEDERMFYPFGDERLLCETTLARSDIRYVVNTRLLYEHLKGTGLPHLEHCGMCFEPSFPATLFHRRAVRAGAKRRFFFYARPNNPRNLFHLGIAVMERAVSEGILNAEEWEICFVGKGIPCLVLSEGFEPRRIEGLGWEAYAELIGSVDLGLSLMYTPHPSYPPLDLAARGAVVVTNKFGVKQDLSQYSPNIICADPNIDSLVEAIRQGVARVEALTSADQTGRQNGIGPAWPVAFSGVLNKMFPSRPC